MLFLMTYVNNDLEVLKMKLAVTYENGLVFQHFGHTEQFKIYEVKNQEISDMEIVNTNGSGHGALAGFLKERGVEALICGGIGGGARAALEEAGIRLYGGVSGEADRAVEAFLGGKLSWNPDVSCSHHSGDHSCHGHDGEEHGGCHGHGGEEHGGCHGHDGGEHGGCHGHGDGNHSGCHGSGKDA